MRFFATLLALFAFCLFGTNTAFAGDMAEKDLFILRTCRDSVFTLDVLENDHYTGQPVLSIVQGPSLSTSDVKVVDNKIAYSFNDTVYLFRDTIPVVDSLKYALTVGDKSDTAFVKLEFDNRGLQSLWTGTELCSSWRSSLGDSIPLVLVDKFGPGLNDTVMYSTEFLQTPGKHSHVEVYTSFEGCEYQNCYWFFVNASPHIVENPVICKGSYYQMGDRRLTQSGYYVDTLMTAQKCDSIIEVNLTVLGNDTVVYDTICSSLVTAEVDSVFSQTVSSDEGCSMKVTTCRHYKPNVSSTFNDNFCAGSAYSFAGKKLTMAGIYTETFTSKSGCDSTVTLNLEKFPFYVYNDTASICPSESYTSKTGQQLKVAGIYYDSLKTIAGCDSVFVTVLQVMDALHNNIYDTICQGAYHDLLADVETWAPGSYVRDVYDGCDTNTVHLTILPKVSVAFYDTVLVGVPYAKNGFNVPANSKSGTFTYTFNGSTAAGCDSIATLYLTVLKNEDNHFIPTAFSPWNQDGVNDIFMSGYEVYVYDRYGNLICHSTTGWNGRYRGKYADPGVYIYMVVMKDGQKKKGTIEVLKD